MGRFSARILAHPEHRVSPAGQRRVSRTDRDRRPERRLERRLAPSYDLGAAASSLPPSLSSPPRTARKRANGPTFPPKQKARTSSRRPERRRMTPLQTSSDPEVLGKASPCFTHRDRRPDTDWSGDFLVADWDRRPSGRRNWQRGARLSRGAMRPRGAPTRACPYGHRGLVRQRRLETPFLVGDWKSPLLAKNTGRVKHAPPSRCA